VSDEKVCSTCLRVFSANTTRCPWDGQRLGAKIARIMPSLNRPSTRALTVTLITSVLTISLIFASTALLYACDSSASTDATQLTTTEVSNTVETKAPSLVELLKSY
jgi:hypothetical protein